MDLIGLIPSFGNVLYTLAAFVVALSVIVAIHEYGHYIVGRWSGIHAEVFSLGFGPVIYSRVDSRGTKWQIAALPLGGYVKFLGDADAASTPDMARVAGMTPDEQRMTIQGAPLWARAATVAAGPVFNFVLSILVFAAVVIWQGVAKDPLTVESVHPLPFEPMELLPGDEIVSVAGVAVPSLEDGEGFVDALPKEPILSYEVRRDGVLSIVDAPHPRTTLVVGVSPQSAAMDTGLLVGDVITGIDGEPVVLFDDLREIVGASNGDPLALDIWRDGETLETSLSPRRADLPLPEGGFETRWLIGISGGPFYERERASPGVFEAVSLGVSQTGRVIETSLSGLYHVVAGAISSCTISGPVRIAQTSGEVASQGLTDFIWFIAVLSTAIGLINLFPIPVLDGGHLVFHAWEAISGRPPSDRVLRVMMSVGLVVVLSFMGFALSNDFLCP
ncbi:MAG: RIP metalloprotease RseP [Pseudomonadota bacterium]